MNRSGYSFDLDPWDEARWRGTVARAMRGKRGQRALLDMLFAFDTMPEKVLAREALRVEDGSVCALGALAHVRKVDVAELDPEDWTCVAKRLDVSDTFAREVAFENDEGGRNKESPAERWQRMRVWIIQQLTSKPAVCTVCTRTAPLVDGECPDCRH